MKLFPVGRMQISRSLQLVFILATFCLDFGHGIAIGERDIAFHPMYRLHQTSAIAIPRLRHPPSRGYPAYQSVVDTLNENGFSIPNGEKGPRLDVEGWSPLFKDTARLDRALAQARDTTFDASLPPQIIRGNEIGIPEKLSEQIGWLASHRAMRSSNLLGATALAALVGDLWLMAGGWRTRISDLLSAATASMLVLASSLVPPLIAPSYLSVGTLLCFLVVALVGAFVLVALAEWAAEAMLVAREQKHDADASHVI